MTEPIRTCRHRRRRFVETACLPEIGHEFGRWLGLVLLQRVVDR